MKRVPISIPSAPSASAANKPRPLPMPPLASTGIETDSTTRGINTIVPMSSRPRWPPPSCPTAITASAPSSSAFCACLTPATRTSVRIFSPLILSKIGFGLPPVMEMAGTFSSIATSSSSSYGRPCCPMAKLTPNGLSVNVRTLRISSLTFSGVPSVIAVICPNPPALETAAASSAYAR